MDVCIRGGTVVLPSGKTETDILVRGETIRSIGTGLAFSGAREIDATGFFVVPGGIDAHTHFCLADSGRDLQEGRRPEVWRGDWRTGTMAAACGGTTTVIEHPGFGPAGCSLFHQIDESRRMAKGAAVIDYSFHGVIQRVNGEVLDELEKLKDAGIPSCKIYLTYDFQLKDDKVLKVLRKTKEIGGLAAIHCENAEVIDGLRRRFEFEGKREPWFHPLSRPAEAEAEAVDRMIRLAEAAGGADIYVVHLSTAAGLHAVRRGRARGARVFAETCPQYLLLDELLYREPDLGGLKYVMSPPLRRKLDRDALWEGLSDGAISTVATDHCAFSFAWKKKMAEGSFLRCPGGAPGVETRMALMFSEGVMRKRISVERFVEVTATAPARIMGLYPRKGILAPGSDADIVLIDPKKSARLTHEALHQNVDYTPFEGMEVTGYPILTMSRGRIIFESGQFHGRGVHGGDGGGTFLKRKLS